MMADFDKAQTNRVVELARKKGVLRPRDLDEIGVPRRLLSRLRDQGVFEQPARGLYVLPDADTSGDTTMAQAAKLVPEGVICLLSALSFHGLTTQLPFQVWMAIDPKDRLPKAGSLPLRVVRFSGAALEEGVEHHQVDGVSVPIYKPAKTVADCFKYRNKVGLDVAIEALQDCWRERMCDMDELTYYAQICRVGRVMKPYLEMLG